MSKVVIAEVAEKVRSARKNKGLSQRDLGQRVGLPQSHISKIESGGVDLKLSSLTELARALDLEVRLVPRRAVAAVDGAVKIAAAGIDTGELRQVLRKISGSEQLIARLEEEMPQRPEIRKFKAALQDVKALPPNEISNKDLLVALDGTKQITRLLDNQGSAPEIAKWVHTVTMRLQRLRNRFVHARPIADQRQRPAYNLEDDDE